jgi:hypothetical protein
MADKATSKEKVTLVDGTELTVQPLKISLLRPFMKRFQDLTAVSDDNEKAMDVLVDCLLIAMKQFKPELSEDKEALEDVLDLPTVYKIIDIASGIQLTDPSSIIGLNKSN